MKRLLLAFPVVTISILVFTIFFVPTPTYAASCGDNGKANDQTVLGFPTWYKYLNTEERLDKAIGRTVCDFGI